ncbi:CutC family protein [Podospora appendiculata]|uniref:Copper homeostasis protein cutC homolog n=1 Tax=Podospora appendiculata TaxID=314037 RepID=A0AAE0X5I4_9PEZI|nr:CutC family protein [Podospora appendiculata]
MPSKPLCPPGRPFEIPVFGPDTSAASVADLAAGDGARRLELNRAGSYGVGGTTPTIDELAALMAVIPGGDGDHATTVRVMIRPRGAPPPPGLDFVYSEAEFAAMREDIVRFVQSGLLRPEQGDGFVFGILKREARGGQEGSAGDGVGVDVERNAELARLARPFRCVFHRAFDDVVGSKARLLAQGAQPLADDDGSWVDALAAVEACGFDGILTSGGPGNAVANAARIGRIASEADGRVEIIVGGGVRSGNVRELAAGMREGVGGPEGLGGVWFHSSCLSVRDGVERFDTEEATRLLQELQSIDGVLV